MSIPLSAEMAVIEMGANAQGEIRDLSQISNPTYGMITNIGKAHLEGFGGIEGVKKGKSELYKHIRSNGGNFLSMEMIQFSWNSPKGWTAHFMDRTNPCFARVELKRTNLSFPSLSLLMGRSPV